MNRYAVTAVVLGTVTLALAGLAVALALGAFSLDDARASLLAEIVAVLAVIGGGLTTALAMHKPDHDEWPEQPPLH